MLGLGSGINRLSAAEAAAIAGRIPGFTGLLDESYGSGATAAYSVRQLSSSETVAMTIRRDSDNSELDIGFDSEGNLDESAISTFCSGTTCKVSSWRDQSGNRNDATQATAANQPTIYTGGAIVKENGRVALDFDGTSDHLTGSGLTLTSSDTYFSTLFKVSNAAVNIFDSVVSTKFFLQIDASNNFLFNNGANTDLLNDNDGTRYLTALDFNSTTLKSYFNGTNTQTATVSNVSVDGIQIGKHRTSQTGWIDGTMQELIYWNQNKNANHASIESNVGDYFTQNTPLLDTYAGATAAYSLRKLRSAYNGSAIRVRRASDNAESDIGFNVFGELSTVELAAHCGSSDGYCVRWYDQSGNANDATQITTANQPKIYDSVTGVVTENGKPAIKFLESGWPYLTASGFGTGNTRFISFVSKMDSEPSVGTRYSMPWIFMQSPINTLGDYLQIYIPDITNSVLLNFPTNSLDISSTEPTNVQNLISINKTSTTSEFWYNTNSQGTGSGTQNMADGLSIGRFASYGQGIMTFHEMVIWNSDQSANRTNIETNINTFYSIY